MAMNASILLGASWIRSADPPPWATGMTPQAWCCHRSCSDVVVGHGLSSWTVISLDAL